MRDLPISHLHADSHTVTQDQQSEWGDWRGRGRPVEHDLLRSSGYCAIAVMGNGFLGRRGVQGLTLRTFPLHLCRSLHKLPFYTVIDTSYTHCSQHDTWIQQHLGKPFREKRGLCFCVNRKYTAQRSRYEVYKENYVICWQSHRTVWYWYFNAICVQWNQEIWYFSLHQAYALIMPFERKEKTEQSRPVIWALRCDSQQMTDLSWLPLSQ